MERLSLSTFQDLVKLHKQYGGANALGRLLAMVHNAGCRTVFAEDATDDREYKAEHEAFFSRTVEFATYAYPTRLHFFRDDIADPGDVKAPEPRYLGYCDIRPGAEDRTICFALIDRQAFVKDQHDTYVFPVCFRHFDVAFAGRTLGVYAFPYIQQDGRAIRCAQAALACVTSYYGKSETGPDLTEYGHEMPTGARMLPSQGLTGRQIGLALIKLGFEPVLYDFTLASKEAAAMQHREQIIYRYLESGIPVIIGIDAGSEGHAMVVVGHTFTPDSWLSQSSTTYYGGQRTGGLYECCTKWIERFVVQDDNFGPYMLVPSSLIQYAICNLIIVPMPPNIFLTGEDAEQFVGEMLHPNRGGIPQLMIREVEKHQKDRAAIPCKDESRFWLRELYDNTRSQEIVLRTFLQDSSAWKAERRLHAKAAGYETLLDSVTLPQTVWVVEISWPIIFRHGGHLCAEVLVDPTASISKDVLLTRQGYVWCHLPGIVLTREPVTNNLQVHFIPGVDAPSPHHKTKT